MLPVGIAAAQGLPARGFAADVSSGLALSALAMVLAQFVTSGRFERTTGRVGIDLTLQGHQLAARFIGVVLLLHPLLYGLPGARSVDGAGSALAGLFAAPRLATGVAAWALLLALIAMAILRDRLPWRYETWRLSHGMGAALAAALGVHHAMTAGRFSADPWLAAVWVALLAVAVGSLLRVYLLTPLLQMRHPWRVVSVSPAGSRLWELVIEPAAAFVPKFAAGQFFWLTLNRSPFSITEHPFSAASAPADLPRLKFLIKESGDFTNSMGALPVGARAYVDGPRGIFTLAGRTGAGIGLVAGGVGIAPILGVLRQLRAEHDPRPVRLLVGNRQPGQIVCADELGQIAAEADFRVRQVLSEPPPGWSGGRGVLDRPQLEAVFDTPDRNRWIYFVCGPGPMMDAVERSLVSMGVPASQIVTERFRYH